MKASTKIVGLLARRFLILNLLFALVLATSAWGGSQPDPLINELSKLSGGKVHVGYHSGTGKVRLLRAEPGAAIPQPFALPRDATPELAARSFLGKYGVLFGIADPSKELTVKRERKADRGRSFVRFQQVHKGIPVIGGELIVQMNSKKDVLSVNGKISPAPAVPTSAVFPSGSAEEKALEMVGIAYQIGRALLKVSEPELWIYNPALLGKGSNANLLVWRMEVKSIETRPIRELVLVDAASGEILLHFNQIDSALNRKIYDHANIAYKPLPGDPADLIRSEGDNDPSGIADVDFAYDYAGDTYNFYFSYHGRDSLDGAGMGLISTTRYCPDDFFNCPYQNAFWDGSQMVYGDGFASADDVVAHEMTHGVTEHESNLIYYNQSGAINESFSDIWGEFVDLTNGRGNDAPSVRWKIGEDLPPGIGVIRDMSDPTVFGDPDRMLSSNYWNHQCDNGGVHINSGIGNKAAYLITDGGSFNGQTITGIGITKVAKIFYEAQTNLLTTSSDYNDLADALQQACTNLTGTNGITESDCQEVVNAIIATEMNQTPPANVLNNPGFEDGALNWTEYTSGGYAVILVFPSFGACLSDGLAWFGGYDGAVDYVYQDVTIPSNATQAYLRFVYAISTYEVESIVYDTMKVELRRPSDNTLLTTLATLSNVDDTLGGWYLSAKYDLTSFKGQNIRLRFYVTTDNYNPSDFYLDDIVLGVVAPPVGPETVSTPNTPSGPLTGVVQTSYSFTTGGSSSNLGDLVQYLFDWGDGTNSGWLAVGTTSASKSWTTQGTYTVKAQARCATHTSIVSDWSGGLSVGIEVVSVPAIPSGPTIGTTGANYTYSTGGSSSNLGHSIQYFFDWGDGTNSGWLPVGTTSASKLWASGGTYAVKAQARCATDTFIVSQWSGTLSVDIETVSTPMTPTGSATGILNTTYSYLTGSSSSILGHSIQYLFNWGDGTDSGWLPVGTTSASKYWALEGTYLVKVQARCSTHASVVSSWSEPLSVIIYYPWAPSPPTNVSASDGTYLDKVEVTWAASSGAKSYTVCRATKPRRWARKTVLGTTSETFFNDATAVPMTTYYYYVKASNTYGTSDFSAYDAGYRSDGTPPAPTNVSASDGVYTDRVEVSWLASPNADSYTVYRATSPSRFARKTFLGTTSGTLFDDTTAVPNTTYYYYVTATNAYGTSNFSAYDAGHR